MASARDRLEWQGISAAASALFVLVTQRVLGIIWRQLRGSPPPDTPTDQSVSWGAALTWAIATGAGVAVARLVAARLSEDVWEAKKHEAPPGTAPHQ
jgi:hypothetical protein